MVVVGGRQACAGASGRRFMDGNDKSSLTCLKSGIPREDVIECDAAPSGLTAEKRWSIEVAADHNVGIVRGRREVCVKVFANVDQFAYGFAGVAVSECEMDSDEGEVEVVGDHVREDWWMNCAGRIDHWPSCC